ncbi:M23 family metallopeptidase [Candidatus Uhrbacteria bacterium]|nr:M23 family metallopeptidase [Candidatus Uhrbacteria bacterium]
MFLEFFRRHKKFSYPLDISDAQTGEMLKGCVPKDQLYKTGPFYCDLSPSSHNGPYQRAIDFIVKDGSIVYASRSGRVVDMVEAHSTYGPGPAFADKLNYITIDHGDCLSQYGHLQKGSPSMYGIRAGKQVMRGQVIGIVGKTGWVDYGEQGDHLHFMVFVEDKKGFHSISVDFI